jgi:hypothetical protein
MLPVLRNVLLLVIALLLLEAVIAVSSGATGVLEKVVVVAFGAGLVLAASRVRRLGAPRAH